MDHSNFPHPATAKCRSFSSKNFPLITHITITLCLVFNPSHLALAQNIEEVTIQAEQQAGEMLDDLVSVAALSGEKLADAGINNVEDVAAYVPNLVLTETETGTSIFIRGIGAGVNQGFDQSVGLYSDGVPLPRANMSRAPFLDLSNVQVLRGPQYVLDGNYSIAGSVHMQTNLSTDEFSAGVDINYVPSQNDQTVLMTVGGPINDQFSARIAIQAKRSDGYMENVTLNQDGPVKDELLGRFIFGWNPTDDLSFKLKVEHGSFDTRGRSSEIILDLPSPDLSNIVGTHPFVGDITRWAPDASRTQLAQPWVVPSIDWIHYPLRTTFDAARNTSQNSDDPNINPGLGFYWSNKSYTQKLAELYAEHGFTDATPAGLQDTEFNYKRASDVDEFSENSIINYTLNSEYWIGEHKLTATSSYIEYEFDELIDADATAAPLFSTLQDEQYTQIFQSFNYRSPAGMFVELRAGASYLKSSLNFHDRTNIFLEDLPYLPISGNTPQADRTFSIESPLRGYLGGWKLGSAPIISFQTVVPDREFEQDTETFAIYLQPTINWTDTFRMILGVRYTRSEKEAVRDLALVTPEGIPLSELAQFNPNPVPTDQLEKERYVGLRTVIFKNYINFFGIQAHTDRFNAVETVNADGTSKLIHNVTGELVDPSFNTIGAIRGSRTEDQLLPSITFEWNVNDDLTLTLSARKANKLGGFDARSNTTPRVKPLQGAPAGTFEFEDEDATTYEIGSLWYLPNGWGEMRSTFFYTEFTNLQLSRFDGRSGFNVDNAGGATTMGVEIEGLLNVSDAFNINYSLAWMDFEFDEFLKGACHLGRAPDHFYVPFDVPVQQQDILRQAHPDYDWNDVNNNGVIDKGDFIPIEYNVPRPSPVQTTPFATGKIDQELNYFDDTQLGAPSFCDFKGQTNQFVAEWQGTFSFNYQIELIGLGIIKPTLDVIYNSGYHTSATQDPLVAQDAFVLFNGRLALASFEDVWEVALTGQNLTNQKIVSYSNDTPIGSRIQGARGFVGFVRPPRSIGLNLRYNFY